MSVYDKLGLKKVINANGTLTRLGGSLMDSEVLEAMADAARSYIDMPTLLEKAGRIAAEITGAEAAYITSGAAAGLVLGTAAIMTGKDLEKMKLLPDTENLKNQVIVQKPQVTDWCRMLRIAGARIIEVGDAFQTAPNHIEKAINEKTAAMAYFIWDPQENVVPLEKVIEIASNHGIPTIVDAAAELPPVENLRKIIAMGADLVVFSGGKEIRGPNDSGIICGRRDLIEACAMQGCPHEYGIGRPMKVSKEQIIGLLVALGKFVKRDHKAAFRLWETKVEYIRNELNHLPHVKAERFLPRKGARPLVIPRVRLSLDEKALGISTIEVAELLASRDPIIDVPLYEGDILINPQCLVDGEERIVIERLKEVLTRKK